MTEPNWPEFWLFTKEIRLTKAEVHTFFGVGPEKGMLKSYVTGRAYGAHKSIPQVIQEMAAEIEQAGPVEQVDEAHPYDALPRMGA